MKKAKSAVLYSGPSLTVTVITSDSLTAAIACPEFILNM